MLAGSLSEHALSVMYLCLRCESGFLDSGQVLEVNQVERRRGLGYAMCFYCFLVSCVLLCD